MKTTLWLTTFSLFASAPFGFSATEVETLRSTVQEQNRQIHDLEEQVMRLRSAAGENVVPPSAKAAAAAKGESATASVEKTYTVKAGDTLAQIARRSDTTSETLAKLNGIKDPTRISIGQKIKLPGKAAPAKNEAVAKADPAPKTEAKETKPIPGSDTYIIRDNDTYYSIARKNKISVDALTAANPGVKASELRTGQVIRLSSGKSSTAAKSSTPKQSAEPQKSVVETPASRKETPVASQKTSSQSPTASPSPAAPASSPAPAPAETAKNAVHSVTIDGEMTYGEFAAKHGTKIERLNELNGLDLSQNTVLAKGSELYVAQP